MKNTKPNLIRKDSKANFLNILEKDALEVILKNARERGLVDGEIIYEKD